MVSSSVEKFAREVDSYIDTQIDTYQKAKSEQKYFISSMNTHSELFAAAGIRSSELQKNARNGLASTRKECTQNIEDKLKLVDSEFESLKKNLKKPDDFMYLYECFNKWIEKITDPFGTLYISNKMKEKWDSFATNTPVLKVAALEKTKSTYNSQIQDQKNKIAELVRMREPDENEYNDYITNYNLHIQNIEKEIESERIEVEREIESIETQLSELESNKMALNRELIDLGIFSGFKKKRIKMQIDSTNSEIDSLKSTVQNLEKKKNDIVSSKKTRISKLDFSIQCIKDRIERTQKKINEMKMNIEKKDNAIKEIDDEIKSLK